MRASLVAGRTHALRVEASTLVWLTPAAAFALAWLLPLRVDQMAAAALALGLVVAAARRPSGALMLLIGLLVFDEVLRLALYRYGLPAGLVARLGGWNEALLLGAAAAAAHHAVQNRHRVDTLDRLSLVLLGFVVVYLIVPGPFVFGELRSMDARVQSFRTYAVLMVSFLAARHMPLTRDTHRRAMRVIMLAGLVLGIQVLFEFLFSDVWNRFVLEQLRLDQFRLATTGVGLPDPTNIRFYGVAGGRTYVRAGSVAFDPIRIAFFFVIPFGVALQLALRGARRWPAMVVLLGGTAVVLTFTRSAVLAALACLVVTLSAGDGPSAPRVRLALVAAAVVLLATPGLVNSGLGDRSRSGIEGTDASTQVHLERSMEGLRTLVNTPLGKGLATGPSVNQLQGFAVGGISNEVNPENSYLLIGNEIGVVPMVLFIWLVVTTARRLRPQPGSSGDRAILQAGLRAALIGLSIGGLLLQVWIDAYTAIAFWGLAGLALNVARDGGDGADPSIGAHGRNRPNLHAALAGTHASASQMAGDRR